jgi:tetratricopeptide (TPR) repeat protein
MIWSLFFLVAEPTMIQTLQGSLHPSSVSQHLALYELYPDTREGQASLERAWRLLGAEKTPNVILSPTRLFDIVNHFATGQLEREKLDPAEIELLEQLGAHLTNRQLAGHKARTEAEVQALDPDQVDVARGLMLCLFPDDEQAVRSYEALLDLMALQILAHTTLDAPPEEKIDAINHFLFDEMYLRFPPHSLWAKDVDLYTFLPSVLDSRRGVCLGVSTLYLCLSQRLALPLEVITPPGHIYVRYRDDEQQINIETTARGIDTPDAIYLGVGTKSLQQRNPKEVIGLNFFNQAAALWQADKNMEAITAYEKGRPYLPGDPLVNEFLGYNYLIVGEIEKGRALLEEIRHIRSPESVGKSTLIEDYLDGCAPIHGIQAVFQHVDETRESILEKRDNIQAVLTDYPKFRAGWFHLAITYLQLGRDREAHEALLQHHTLDSEDPVVAYYLAATAQERRDLASAWTFLHEAEHLAQLEEYEPRALTQLRRSLRLAAPE